MVGEKSLLRRLLTCFYASKTIFTFLKLGSLGKYKEQSNRQELEKPFDFLTFNIELTLSQGSSRYAALLTLHVSVRQVNILQKSITFGLDVTTAQSGDLKLLFCQQSTPITIRHFISRPQGPWQIKSYL